MKTLFLSPDYRCNERCVFCPCAEDARRYTPLTLSEMKESLDVAIEKEQIEMVLLSGGEPTLKKEILDFIAYVRTRNIKLGVLSNSLKFTSDRYLNKFLAIAGTDFELTTAFHSRNAMWHDQITQVSHSFERSFRGIQNLIERGVQVTIKYNLNNLTYKDLPQYADWIYDHFPDDVPWVICNIDICGIALLNKEYTAVPFHESRPYLEAALDKVIEQTKQGRKRAVQVFNTPLCCIDPYYWSFLQKSEGGILSALRLPYEQTEENKLQLSVKGDGDAAFAPCKECALQPQCPGTWKRTGEVYGNEVFQPFIAD